MIEFLSKWIEQITISVIVVSILELVLPKGNLKKYIKVVLGIYVLFCMISPFANSSKLYDFQDINLEKYNKNTSQKTTNINQERINKRIQELYIEQLKKDIEKNANEDGYYVTKCDINANLSENIGNSGINQINLVLSKDKIVAVQKVEIGNKNNDKKLNNEDVEKIKEKIANEYGINKDTINIQIKSP